MNGQTGRERGLSLAEVNRAMAGGETTARALVEAALGRAAQVEAWLHAFVWLDPQRARRLADEADTAAVRRRAGGPAAPALPAMQGVPVGIKDIVDTAGLPTEHGSALFAGRVPDTSAAVVQALERAGAVVLGKTVTAELAYFHPGPTVNPWHREHTSGGSSMGSAAAVGAGIVPAAVGTQTNGSVIRPAAFCGVVGFKPSAGRVSRIGILGFSETLDQPGGFTRSVADAAWLAAAMTGEPLARWWDDAATPPGRPRLALAPTRDWTHAAPEQQARFRDDVAALIAAGAQIEEPPLPEGLDESPAVHHTIMAYEGAQALGETVARSPARASSVLREFLARGATIPAADYRAALAARDELIERFGTWAAPYDAVLTPPAAGEAPGRETTGDPRFCTRWTLLGAPALVVPTGLGRRGLPLGLQLVGTPGSDRRLLGAGAWVEAVLPGIGPAPG
jgi:Asp-tRNA(Asn)/Glu-tRNA(Gln) amidotransferase A subunit family amidase